MYFSKREYLEYLYRLVKEHNYNYSLYNDKIYFHDTVNKTDILASYLPDKPKKKLVDDSTPIIYPAKEVKEFIEEQRQKEDMLKKLKFQKIKESYLYLDSKTEPK